MSLKSIFRDFFTFNRNERRGITILIILIFLLVIVNKLFFYFETPSKIDPVLFDSARIELGILNDSINKSEPAKQLFLFDPNSIDGDSLRMLKLPQAVKQNLINFRKSGGQFLKKEDFKRIYGITDEIYYAVEPYLKLNSANPVEKVEVTKAQLFFFDPNKASDEEFHRLGLSEKQITILRNYQKKGGCFRQKDDFMNLWGLTEHQKSTLADFIRIEVQTNLLKKDIPSTKIILIELNTADSIQLELLPGIGEKLSKRIVKYRDLLGGFYSLQQLTEVYGLSKETIDQFSRQVTIDKTKIKKIDLNFADIREISRHPYLKNQLARKIVNFRSKNGSIPDPAILRDSMILNIQEYTRIEPYFENKSGF